MANRTNNGLRSKFGGSDTRPSRRRSQQASDIVYSTSILFFEEQFKRVRKASLAVVAENNRRASLILSNNNNNNTSKPNEESTTMKTSKNRMLCDDVTSRENYFKSVVDEYRKAYRGDEGSLKESAADILNQVTQSGKSLSKSSKTSWLRQVEFGARIASAKVKRSLVRADDRHTAKI